MCGARVGRCLAAGEGDTQGVDKRVDLSALNSERLSGVAHRILRSILDRDDRIGGGHRHGRKIGLQSVWTNSARVSLLEFCDGVQDR